MKYIKLTILWILIFGMFAVAAIFPIHVYALGLIPALILYRLIYRTPLPKIFVIAAIWPLMIGCGLNMIHEGLNDNENLKLIFKDVKEALKA